MTNVAESSAPGKYPRVSGGRRGAENPRARMYRVGDEEYCLSEWARRCGCSTPTLTKRLRNGWPVEAALTKPPGSPLKHGLTRGAIGGGSA